MIARRALLAALAGCAGCDPKRAPARPPGRGGAAPARAAQPEDLLPAGVDVVARVELGRLRDLAHSPALDPLREPLERRLRDNDQASLLDLLRLRATRVVVGVRGVPGPDRLDAVLVARGDFATFDPSTGAAPFQRVPDGRPGRTVFERTGERLRSAPSLLVLLGGETLVLATPLESEGVLRALDQGAPAATLQAPADGLLGLAARPEALTRAAAQPYPHLASVLSELATLAVVGDVEQGALRLDVLMTTQSDAGAQRVEKVMRGWREAFRVDDALTLRLVSESTSIERDGPRSLKLRLRTSGEPARKLFGALLG